MQAMLPAASHATSHPSQASRPLPPELEAGWQRVQREQRELDAHLAPLRPDAALVRRREEL